MEKIESKVFADFIERVVGPLKEVFGHDPEASRIPGTVNEMTDPDRKTSSFWLLKFKYEEDGELKEGEELLSAGIDRMARRRYQNAIDQGAVDVVLYECIEQDGDIYGTRVEVNA